MAINPIGVTSRKSRSLAALVMTASGCYKSDPATPAYIWHSQQSLRTHQSHAGVQMQLRFFRLGRRAVAIAATVAVAVVATTIRLARASDHQDNPLVELNPAMDMTDVY